MTPGGVSGVTSETGIVFCHLGKWRGSLLSTSSMLVGRSSGIVVDRSVGPIPPGTVTARGGYVGTSHYRSRGPPWTVPSSPGK